MQLLSGIAQFLTRPPSTTDHRSDPATNPDNFASHGGEEVEDLEGTSGARTDVTSNVRRGNSSFLSRGHFAKPSGRSNMRREDETSDEQRLFPTYKQSQDDVRITVGQSFAKPKKSRVNQHSILRPVDLITPNGKDSGPVRARGGSNTTNTSVQHSTSSRHPLSSPTRVDNEHRALKRRRHSSSPVIDLVDDDEGNTIRNRSPSVASVESPEDREKEKTPTRVFKVPEYDEDDDPEESYVGVKSTRTQHRPNKPIETVEVDDDDARSQGEEDKAGSEKRRRSDASESPDELQEDVTFRTNPESFASNRPTIGSYSFLYEADQKPSKGVKRRLSPNDIRPTVFNSSNKTPDRRQPRNQRITRTHKYLFDVKFFRYGSIQLDHRQLFLDQGNDTIGLHQSIPPVSIPIRRIIQVLLGAEGSLKCRFTLSKIQGATNKDSVDIEFATEAEKDQLCGLLPKTARIREKTGEWMDKAFDNVVIVEPVRGKRLSSPDITESGESTKPETVKRQRLSATLQGEDEPLKGINQPPRRVPLPVTQSVSIAPKTPRSGDDEGVSIPVKTYQASCKERETRSKARRGLIDLIDDEPDSSPKSDSGDRWSKPLVYPPVGKKKAEVNSYDLERLRDGEFLNDNLIGFYARFLEHYLERNKPEVSKRVYFFNSYFYATLTSPVKGRRGVNYQGVSKWTRNVDLFSHDYVVVPINESAHWYLAIICNLSTLKKRSEVKEIESSQEEPEAQKKVINQKEIPETPPPREAATPEETARDSLAAMKIDDVPNSKPQNGPNSEDEWPEKEENQTSPPAVFHGDIPSESDAAKRKKFKSSGPAYSIDQPTIITFDSLNEPRQPAIKVLKQYLMEESIKAKISFEMKDIKGMTAKGIPLQPNYSDCGLYLLAYLEKFVQDPDEFVRKILRREMSIQIDWPPLKSGWLRRRLRDFLFKLHKEQDPGQDTGLLVDTQPISYLLGPPVQSAKKVQDVEVAPVAEPEPEVIVDSFQDKEEANDDAVSDVESVIQETQFSEQQGVPVPQLEQETTDESKEEQHVEEVIEVPKTPDREINNDAAVLDSSPVVIANSAPEAQKETPHRDQQAQRDIFEEMSDYLSRTPPRDNVEVQIPTVQVLDTPRAKKTRKERTSPRQIKSKKKI